jgi:hypothetical protein
MNKKAKKLRLNRDTLQTLSAELTGAAGGVVLSVVCSVACHSNYCETGDTMQSCNVFSCASCAGVSCLCEGTLRCV